MSNLSSGLGNIRTQTLMMEEIIVSLDNSPADALLWRDISLSILRRSRSNDIFVNEVLEYYSNQTPKSIGVELCFSEKIDDIFKDSTYNVPSLYRLAAVIIKPPGQLDGYGLEYLEGWAKDLSMDDEEILEIVIKCLDKREYSYNT